MQTDLICSKPTRPNLAKQHYQIKFNNIEKFNDVEYDYDDFDYEIIKPNISPFADSLVNEIWPFLRILWRTKGGYKLRLIFDKDLDMEEFGTRGSVPIDAEYLFEIDDSGTWSADFKWDFKQEVKSEDKYKDIKWKNSEGTEFVSADPEGPVWKLTIFSKDNSNSAVRARKLAWRGDEDKKDLDPYNAFNEEDLWSLSKDFINARQLDFSFTYDWQGTGKWTF